MEYVDGIRLREFRQVRKDIRGSDKYLIVGIDVAKERHNAYFGTATGRTLHKGLVFDNTIEGFRKLLTLTEALKVQYELMKVIFGVEPTANYHKPVGEHLIKCGQMVVLVSAAAVKNNPACGGADGTNTTPRIPQTWPTLSLRGNASATNIRTRELGA